MCNKMNLEILAKYLSGEADQIEISQVEDWLQLDSKNFEILETYKTAWNLPEKLNENSDLPKIWNQISDNIKSSKKSRFSILDYISNLLFGKMNPVLKYSFVAIILLIPLLFIVFKESESLVTYVANDLSHSKIKLSDGSIVTLDRSSKIIYPETFTENERKIEIIGEAFFDVVPDSTKPFIINVSNSTVTVLGTSFNIRGWDKNISVAVIEGKVRFTSVVNEAKKSVILVKNQKSEISKNGFPTDPTSFDPSKSVRWIEGYYNFETATVKEVTHQLERWYNVEIHFADTTKISELINITIDKSSLKSNLDLLIQLINSNYKIEGKTIMIK